MRLDSITLLNYRNISKQSIKLDRKTTLFIGENAQGKTNIIEGIFTLATTKSFRTNKDLELVKWGETNALVSGKFGPNEVKVVITSENKKLYINKQLKNKSTIVGMLPVVLFSPESLNIVIGAPDKRRKYLDQVLSMTNKTYLFNLIRYFKAIKNRNRLLSNIRLGQPGDLSIWDRQLVSLGSYIWAKRIAYIQEANLRLKRVTSNLVDSKIVLKYQPLPKKTKEEKEIGEMFGRELIVRKDEDIARGITSFGPHRDDFSIFFEIIKKDTVLEKNIGSFGSRGEQRIATLALKLLEVEFIERETGEKPILLLDDILSELDEKNRRYVVALLSRQQSIVTATTTNFFPKKNLLHTKIFEVADGKVTLVKAR